MLTMVSLKLTHTLERERKGGREAEAKQLGLDGLRSRDSQVSLLHINANL